MALTDIHVPVFAVGTERDHVAPWQSTYKINLQVRGEVTYVLATGGHNVGIVSEPGKAGHSFRMLTKPADERYLDPVSIPRRREATRLFVVAGLDRMDWRTFQRRNGVAAYGGAAEGLPDPRRCARHICVWAMTWLACLFDCVLQSRVAAVVIDLGCFDLGCFDLG